MGRRKIEIKPIRDERNRSVTFLKRKAGLFKKAHELSVLCSVDVAVIVFGNSGRNANNEKLYEYSSSDLHSILRRQQTHGTPNEHKGPGDYRGHDEEDDDEDEYGAESPPSRTRSRAGSASRASHLHLGAKTEGTDSPRLPSNHSQNSAHASPALNAQQPHPQPQQHAHQAEQPRRPGFEGNPPGYQQMIAHHFPQANWQLTQGMTALPVGATYPYPQSYPHGHPGRQPAPPSQPGVMNGHPPNAINLQSAPSAPNLTVTVPADSERAIKSRSMFTPVATRSSALAAHFAGIRQEPKQSALRTLSIGALPENIAAQPHEDLQASPTSLAEFSQRAQSARPRLKVQIPNDGTSDGGSITSPGRTAEGEAISSGNKDSSDGASNSGVHLPPPSPSNAYQPGSNGSLNPFASTAPRPEQTPLSAAAPSRFAGDLLPSPSSFYPEWSASFGRGADAMLPSPLNFQTPVVASAPPLRDINQAQQAASAHPASVQGLPSTTSNAAPHATSEGRTADPERPVKRGGDDKEDKNDGKRSRLAR